MIMYKSLAVAALAIAISSGAEIVLPSNAMEREGNITAIYRTNQLATGKGELSIKWTDTYGRVIESRKMPVQLNDENEIAFSISMRRAVAMKNELRAHFSFDGVNKKGTPDHREEDAHVDFIAKPPDRQWWDYIIVMWQRHTAAQVKELKQVGINGGESVGRNKDIPDFLLSNNLRWYSENIATDFYSEYHRYFPDRPVNWKFAEIKEQYKKDHANKELFKRRPSFSDPVWLEKIRNRLVETAKFYAPYRPIFYSLGDETGIADLAAPWDFDFSDESLNAMRPWLRQRYGTLQALNDQWGSNFTSWDSVIPPTTDEAMKQPDDNFSAWSDFKEWMDVAFSGALKMGTDAIRSVDPEAHVGIGGGQMPGWGGYDYSRITKSLTAIEPYDIGNNIEIIRSLNPAMAITTTSFAIGPWEQHRVWYEMLHGNRGLVIWDDKAQFIGTDNKLGVRAHEVEPYYKELRNGIAAQLINSKRLSDPIAIHYSQPSMRVEWMLEQRPNVGKWMTRGAKAERSADFVRLRESYCRLIEDQGLQYKFVAYGQVEEGELIAGGYKVLILPRSTALSAREVAAIRDFIAHGGTVIADGMPGAFDEHGKRAPKPQLADLFDKQPAGKGKAILIEGSMLNYHQDRLAGKEASAHQAMGGMLDASGVRPVFAVTDQAGKPIVGLETHTFQNGGVTIVAVMTNPQLRVDELGPPEFKSNERFAKPATARLTFPVEMFVYDMRSGKTLGKQHGMSIAVQPYEPLVFSLSPVALPDFSISLPARVERGNDILAGLNVVSPSSAAEHVMHADVVDPSGNVIDHYSGNVLAPHGRAGKPIPIALNDPPGKWRIKVRDVLTGVTKSAEFEVF